MRPRTPRTGSPALQRTQRARAPKSSVIATALVAVAQLATAVRGLCQKDGCDEFRVLSADPVTSTEEGRLLRTRIQTFHASRAGRQERAKENGYVFCSPARPAIMAEQNGQTMAFFLAPSAKAADFGD